VALCPNCRHEVSRHSSSHECGEPGCSCIFEPQSTAAFERTAVTPAPLVHPAERRRLPGDSAFLRPVLLAIEHPYIALVLLSFFMMGLTFGIEAAEDWEPTADWIARHASAMAWVKNSILLLSVPGIFILAVCVPGSDSRDRKRPVPRWFLSALIAGFIAALLYGALKIHLAGR